MTTSTYLGANELQTIRTFGKDVDEIQLVRTLARPHREEQWVTATAPAGSTLAGTRAGPGHAADGRHAPVHGRHPGVGRGVLRPDVPSSPWSRRCRTWASAWSPR